ncbi:MAG: ABC transporter substrate-binding protein [Desulfofustis sp.]|nr:ABC transporter substrate-binding protein [Desulfofustis sp.]
MSAAMLCIGLLGNQVLAADCTTKIGVALPTSVDWGRPIAATTQFAVDLVNEAGGVSGCNIEVVLRDTQNDPKVGVDAARSLVDLEKVKLLLGAVSSGVSMPILTSVTVPSNVMQMSCCSSSTAFTKLSEEGKTKGLWFRTFATSEVQANAATILIKEKGFKNVAIFYKNDDWGQDMGRLVADNLKKLGVNVTTSIAINDGQASYQAEVAKGISGKPDAIYLALYPKEGISIVRNWISLGGTQEMVVANSLKSDEFRDKVGFKYLAAAIGTDTSSPRVDSATAFIDIYKERFDSEPNGPGLSNAFDATMIALLAMQAAGKDADGPAIAKEVSRVTDPQGTPITADTAGFKKAITILHDGGSVMYQGATGNVQFDKNGDVFAPAVAWVFTESGIKEERYVSLEEIKSFMDSIN